MAEGKTPVQGGVPTYRGVVVIVVTVSVGVVAIGGGGSGRRASDQ